MARLWRFKIALLLVAVGLAAPAWAETIELVTYYPTSSNTGDLHTRSLTVGTGYQGVDMSASDKDGVALIYDKLWIGQGYTPAADLDPAALRVVGFPGQPDKALFLPGTGGGTLNVGIGTTAPASVMHVVTTAADAANDILLDGFNANANAGPEFITRRARGTPVAPADVAVGDDLGGLKFFGYRGGAFLEGATIDPEVDNGPVIAGQIPTTLSFRTGGLRRLSITSAGNVGIGTAAPAARFHIQGADDAASNVVFTEGADTAAAGTPAIRLGVGIAAPTAAASPANGSATGNIDANDVWLRGANRWASQGGGGPQFLPSGEVLVVNATGSGAMDWTTVDLSAYVPVGTRSAIGYLYINPPSLPFNIYVSLRKNAASPEFQIGSSASDALLREHIPVVVWPLDENRRFQVKGVAARSGARWSITLQGYYT